MKSFEENDQETEDVSKNILPPPDVVTYNELRSVAELYRLVLDGQLDLKPVYQRNEVWADSNQVRFLDSLLKEFPIPSMCFSYDRKRGEMKAIDGLQRISTIRNFLDEKIEKKYPKLDDVDSRLSGKTNIEIQKENPEVVKNIENVTIPVTFLRVDHEKSAHNEFIFQIFSRLNTYGVPLSHQEIRNCVYNGPFLDLVKDLSRQQNWKKLLGFQKDARYQKAELVLRFFALFEKAEEYDGKLVTFLNSFSDENRHRSAEELSQQRARFDDVVTLILGKITDGEKLERRSNALVEALMCGIAHNFLYLNGLDSSVVKAKYQRMLKSEHFSKKALSEGTMVATKVKDRMRFVREVFAS